MRIKDWLIDLADNHYWDIIDGEVVILPIKEGEDEQYVLEMVSIFISFYLQADN